MSRAPPTSRDVRCGVAVWPRTERRARLALLGTWCAAVFGWNRIHVLCRAPQGWRRAAAGRQARGPPCRRAVVPSCRVVQSCRLRFASGTPAEGNRRPAAGGQTSGQPRPGAAQARAEVRRRAGPGGRRTCPSAPPSAPCTSSSPPDQHSPRSGVEATQGSDEAKIGSELIARRGSRC